MSTNLDDLFESIKTFPYPYPGPLSADLEPWHLHTVDQGHCIAVAVASIYGHSDDPREFLVPIPVSAVRRIGYQIRDGYVVCDLEYDPRFGVRGDFGPDLEFEGVDPDE